MNEPEVAVKLISGSHTYKLVCDACTRIPCPRAGKTL